MLSIFQLLNKKWRSSRSKSMLKHVLIIPSHIYLSAVPGIIKNDMECWLC